MLGFLDYALDVANARLYRDSQTIPLRPKVLAVLHYLAERPGRLVTKAALLDAVWADTTVTEGVLTGTVKELREALGDPARQPRIIETVHRNGYRFIAEVRPVSRASRVADTLLDPSPARATFGTSIVGRQTELETLTHCWQQARAGDRQIVFVVGEAGVGKTTLVDECLRRFVDATVATQGSDAAPNENPTTCLLARGQCIEQHGAGEPYLPVLEALGRLCVAPGGAPLVDLLRRHAPAWLVQLPGVLAPEECEALERRVGTSPRLRMLREMAALVAALPAPLVLVLEDLHWSDHATLDLVSTLAQRRDPSRLLLIGTYRSVEVVLRNHPLRTVHQDLRARALCQDLWLEPLSEGTVAEYLEARWPGVTSAADLARAVHEHTDGNPLFIVNIADYLAAHGAVVEVEGRWHLQGKAPVLALDIPQGLQQMIATQIDRLDAAQRTTLEAGSLVGRQFSAALVAAALVADVIEIEEHLAHLSRSGLMIHAEGASEWPDGVVAGAYRFHHFLYQSVLRERVPPARRRQLHERIATRLERAYRGQLAEVSAELAFHFEASGQAECAVPYLEESATRATRIGAHHEATALLEHALAILDRLPPTPERKLHTIRLCMALGPALAPAHGYGFPQIEQAYQRARQLSEESNDPVPRFQTLVAMTGTYVMQARYDRAQGTARQLEEMLPSMSIPPFVFAGSLFMGMVKYHAGDLGEARQLLERAVSLAAVPLPPLIWDLHAVALSYLSMTLIHQGYPDQGRASIQAAVQRSSAGGRPFDRGLTAYIRCFTHLLLRDIEGLAAAAAEASALEDFPAIAALGRLSYGRVMIVRGEHEPALDTMRQALDAYLATGQNVALPLLLAALAEGHAAAGDAPAALAYVIDARTAAESTGEIRYLAELHRLEGTLHAAREEHRVAERCFRRAIAVAREQGARWWELRATTSLMHLALETGASKKNQRTRRDELAAIAASFDEGFGTPDLQEAQRLLESLSND